MYERIKMIKGKPYRYLVRGVREGKIVKQKVVKYLGPVNPVRQRKKSTGRKPSSFVKELTEEEKCGLRQAKRSSSAFIRDRTKIILLSSERKTIKEISEKLQRDSLSVRRIVKEFNKNSLDVLKRKTSGGRPKTITDEEINGLIETAVNSPKDVGLPYNNWTCKMLSFWFSKKYGKKISSEWVRRLMKKNKITFTMPKHKLLKASEKLRSAFKKN